MSAGFFNGKVAIVTGGASGSGRATALAFAEAGAKVAVADLALEGGKETVESIERAGGDAIFVGTDVSRPADVEALVARTVDELGPLSFAANCAAIEQETTRLADLDEETFDRIIAVNLKSIFLCLKYEIKAMLDHGRGGAIVNIASTNSFRPQPRQTAYTASKHGVVGITRTAAIEYARDGIRVNAVCPGAIRTPMLENRVAQRGGTIEETAKLLSLLGRVGEPAEVAKAVLWLCSDDSSFTLGHTLAVDGGYLAR
ncbi:MAG TPA: glucose 1-dehydrogenase [Acidimicrobiales bacterium]|nr:glucose 1-dehydrogenase [Acidimicrobiales bacterium]